MKKRDLPSKTCAACGRPFTWRRKWEKVWDEVRYCSDACRSGRYGRARAGNSRGGPNRRSRGGGGQGD